MYYEGPIYRPPSEADSLLIQATIGCPYNKCSFCMTYKKGPPFRNRPVEAVCKDIEEARVRFGPGIETLFFPAGNTIAMPSEDLAALCAFAGEKFPGLRRITVYGSSRYIGRKSAGELSMLKEAGLSRIHVGLESGDDDVLKMSKKGTTAEEQIRAGRMVKLSGLELSEYVLVGLGGRVFSRPHALGSARAISAIKPDFVRLRTLVPKINTLLLHRMRKGLFQPLTPHGALRETLLFLENLKCSTLIRSDHYSNYLRIEGRFPEDKQRMLSQIKQALTRDESRFRPFFIGTQ